MWLAQARGFADNEQYLDAVARADLVVDEIARAVTEEKDAARRAKLERRLLHATRLRERLTRELDAWRSGIAKVYSRKIAEAADEMKRPLPKPPPA